MLNRPDNRARGFRAPRFDFARFSDFACWMLVIAAVAVTLLYLIGDLLKGQS